APASPAEQAELLKAWLLAFFFQELLPTRPILALIGEPGSGKTTAMRRILRVVEDPFTDVLGVPTDKQDAFRTSIESHRLLVLDNLEKSGAWWMVDMLNKLSTGSHIEVRKLYKTNEKHVIIPQCFVACTAVNVPFSDETLFSRLLVLEMEKLYTPLPEHILQLRIAEFGPSIWGDLLRKLGEVVEVIRANEKIKAPTSSRLADFTMFCERIKRSSVVDGEALSAGLLSMVDSQLKQLKESSPAIQLLEDWIMLRPDEAAEWRSIQQLYEILREMAQARKVNFRWRSSHALWRHLGTLEPRLRKDFQAELKREMNPASRKEEVTIKFNTSLV
ncbi:ATP-binding protein, partial [bacterium]|nr:ATP-binding protein [bacterium]